MLPLCACEEGSAGEVRIGVAMAVHAQWYWSPIRYCAVPSPTKPRASLGPQPVLWARSGAHMPLHMCCNEPQTAAAMAAKRQRLVGDAAEESKAEPHVTEYDLWPIFVQAQIRNTSDDRQAHIRLMQHVKAHCSHAVCAFVFKSRARLPSLIDGIWPWEGIDSVLATAT